MGARTRIRHIVSEFQQCVKVFAVYPLKFVELKQTRDVNHFLAVLWLKAHACHKEYLVPRYHHMSPLNPEFSCHLNAGTQ